MKKKRTVNHSFTMLADHSLRRRRSEGRRIIGHLDMDAFFAAVEERNNPRWRGLPLVVGADPQNGQGRGVVSTANYAARRYGIHSAQPITQAWRASEAAHARGETPAIFVSGTFGNYGKVSRQIMEILATHVSIIQKRSIDEAYFDLSHTGSYAAATALGHKIKADIAAQTQLTASIGIGPNKLIAKIASDYEKPDGLTTILPENTKTFLAPMLVRAIPGVGPKTAMRLRRLGLHTIADLQAYSPQKLQNLLGKWGPALYEKSHGRDTSPLTERRIAKSIGEQRTFRHDTLAPQALIERLTKTCHHLIERLTDEGFRTYRTVTLTVRFADFTTCSRAHTLPTPARTFKTLHTETLRLLLPFLDHRENPAGQPIRLLGARLEKLS